MVIVNNKGRKIAFINVNDNYLSFKYILFVSIDYLLRVAVLFKPSVAYGKRF